MRQALFAIVLVAASFAGGAVVNGPGLRWAQNAAMNRLGFGDDEEEPRRDRGADEPDADARTDAGRPDADSDAGPDRVSARPAVTVKKPAAPPPLTPVVPRPEDAPPAPLADEIPASPIPPLVLDPPAAEKAADKEIAPAKPAETPPPREMEPPAVAAALPSAAPPQPLEAPPAALPTPAEPAPKAGDPALERASLGEPPAASKPEAAPGDPADWAAVRNALRALGVTRYGTEGDARGRVRFFCLIPLAGRRAVGQHFEAEGDDELQAARAALRRVALWRATEADAGRAP